MKYLRVNIFVIIIIATVVPLTKTGVGLVDSLPRTKHYPDAIRDFKTILSLSHKYCQH